LYNASESSMTDEQNKYPSLSLPPRAHRIDRPANFARFYTGQRLTNDL